MPNTTTNPTGIPVWLRVPGIIALILVGTLAGAMLLGATGIAGPGMNHGNQNQPQNQNEQQHGPGRHGR